ncbi:MAG: class I SAM-dependent methyltransferase [Halobacteriota archaeon]
MNLGDIEETLLLPLWGRATISRDYPSLLNDAKAVELVEQIDYDFSTIDNTLRYVTHINHAARAKQIDDTIRAYLAEHPEASVINLGAGLDTAFYRVDNGTLRWYDLDLPSVMALRSELLPAPERVTYLSDSLFDPGWFADVTRVENGVFMLAAGVFMYFAEPHIRTFLSSLADTFPNAEIVFDTQSRFAKLIGDWRLRSVGMHGSTTKWACTDARTITKWDDRIVVVDQFPVFNNIQREPAWGTVTKRYMDFVDRYRMRNVVHLRV